MTDPSLPTGFTSRLARMDDMQASMELFNLSSNALIGEDECDIDDVSNQWHSTDLHPETDVLLVFAPNGQMAGYIEVWGSGHQPVHPWVWGCTHPDFHNLGLEMYTMAWADERCRQILERIPADLRLAPRGGAYAQDAAGHAIFQSIGWTRIRSNYTMRIDLEAPPPEPVWTAGITLRPYEHPAHARAVYAAHREAFRDHFGYVELPFEKGFERFIHYQAPPEYFDPSLWFIAMDGDEIAGYSLCVPDIGSRQDTGWVNSLGVRRPWRKCGLGLALLQHSFGEFYRHGRPHIRLGVDAQNLTGALRLYQKAGMRVEREFVTYEKEIRAGREISVQSLDE
jgi:ribosomal protein S18 acetylase RimI-like enzyme